MTVPTHDNKENHYITRIGWLRASVLGANDGIVSTASLIAGVASANMAQAGVLLAGTAGLVAGAMSMAAGEYVSVSSQSDSENADIERERIEQETAPEFELQELAAIYESRGLDANLASEVATQLMEKDPLGAHVRDELGISEHTMARPIQAALFSAASFTAGAALPLATVVFVPESRIVAATTIVSVVALAAMGAVAARAGGAPMIKASVRVAVWGAIAMAATAAVGRLFGVALG